MKFRQGAFGVDIGFGHGDQTSLVAEGVGNGCFVCNVGKRRPGELVGISFCSKGNALVRIGWRNGGNWDWRIPTVFVPVTGKADAEGWIRTDWCVTVPDGADGFGLMLGVRQCAGEKTDLGVATLQYRKTSRVEVTDAAKAVSWLKRRKLTDCFRIPAPEVAKTAVKKLLTAGTRVPGCALVEDRSYSLK